MLGNRYADQNCSIARALEEVGERWTLLVVRELLHGPRRFSQLERDLAISKNVLASRLEKLLAANVIVATAVDEAHEWNAYGLTRKGRDLFPVVNALMAWGDRYYAPAGAPAIFRHACGAPTGHKVVCEACAGTVDADSISAVPGPGFKRARPPQRRRRDVEANLRP